MKALIVIDIEDKAFEYYSKQNPKDLTVDLMDHVGESRGFYRPKFLSLKPMPQKQNATEIAIEIEKFKIDDKLMYQVEGWNRCIGEILGEEDE